MERSPGALVWDVGVAAACWSGQGTTVKWSRDKKGETVEIGVATGEMGDLDWLYLTTGRGVTQCKLPAPLLVAGKVG